ncbi:hypothetical protein [Fortiea contorta]|uniref:hypothetical protein n=1 Tax=Fortiea contorta TaxID=1892405 RepID=UPI0012B64CC2|nr:hypothetical protein [Fortiea contorta]
MRVRVSPSAFFECKVKSQRSMVVKPLRRWLLFYGVADLIYEDVAVDNSLSRTKLIIFD